MQENYEESDNSKTHGQIMRERFEALDKGLTEQLIDIAQNGEVIVSSSGETPLDENGEPKRRSGSAQMLKLIRDERNDLRTRLEDEAGLRGEVEDRMAQMGHALPSLDEEGDDAATR